LRDHAQRSVVAKTAASDARFPSEVVDVGDEQAQIALVLDPLMDHHHIATVGEQLCYISVDLCRRPRGALPCLPWQAGIPTRLALEWGLLERHRVDKPLPSGFTSLIP
jgi:hypothetical protein